MLRSMFSGVAGLRSHQTMMDVVGNNISNVNTAGYKSTRVTFAEALSQTLRGATAATPATGGTNPLQLGLGTAVAGIDGVFGQGALQLTGRATDMAVEGDGFFVVRGGENATDVSYTRSGAFSFDAPDAAGMSRLVALGGQVVQGFMGDPPDPTAPPEDIVLDLAAYNEVSFGTDGTITGRDVATGQLTVLGQVAIATFANPNGLVRQGSSMFVDTPNSGVANVGAPGIEGRGTMQAGSLEMSNVDLALEFTNLIIAQRGFQANARTITASDELLQDLVNIKR